MASFLATIAECFTGHHAASGNIISEKPSLSLANKSVRTTQAISSDILTTLFDAPKNDLNLEVTLHSIVSECGWTENIAERVLTGLQAALEKGAPMGQAMKAAFEKVTGEATEFAREHPWYFAVIALGILVVLAPWAIEALGFSMEGPVEGTFAAWWQSTYAGYVPKKSLFSFFQRLGMIWRKKLGIRTRGGDRLRA